MLRTSTMMLCAAFCLLGLSSDPSAAASFPTKLFLSQDGLAFSDFPSRQVLTRTIRVNRTQGHGSASWTAMSDQPWLSVTPSGVTGDALTLKVKTKGLTKDQFYPANVTVSTGDADFTDTETLRVGLWVGSTDPATLTFQKNAINIATNPVAPVAYIADGGTSILEYNVYSGTLVGTFKKVAPTVGYMEVSSDGATLFATDSTNYKIIAMDANSGAVLGKYDVGYQNNLGFNMAYARPFGQPALYIAGIIYPEYHPGRIIAYPSGEELAVGIAPGVLATTSDGQKIFSVDGSELDANNVRLRNGNLFIDFFTAAEVGQNCSDVAVSHDGTRVYPACGFPYQFDVFSGKNLGAVRALPANPYPDNIEIDASDRVIGGISGLNQDYDVYVFDQKGHSLGEVATTSQSRDEGQQTGAMKVSSDGTRVISVTDPVYNRSQTLMFRNLP